MPDQRRSAAVASFTLPATLRVFVSIEAQPRATASVAGRMAMMARRALSRLSEVSSVYFWRAVAAAVDFSTFLLIFAHLPCAASRPFE